MTGRIVIVGAGQAGLQVGLSLREAGYAGDVTMLGDEPGLPYQRPPLSKAYLLGKVEEDGLQLRKQSVLSDLRLDLVAPATVTRIDREHGSVVLASGEVLMSLKPGHERLEEVTDSRPLGLRVRGEVLSRRVGQGGPLGRERPLELTVGLQIGTVERHEHRVEGADLQPARLEVEGAERPRGSSASGETAASRELWKLAIWQDPQSLVPKKQISYAKNCSLPRVTTPPACMTLMCVLLGRI